MNKSALSTSKAYYNYRDYSPGYYGRYYRVINEEMNTR